MLLAAADPAEARPTQRITPAARDIRYYLGNRAEFQRATGARILDQASERNSARPLRSKSRCSNAS